MVAHMKTTIEIPDPLLEEARKVAAAEGSSVRALVEAGLRRVLVDKRRRSGFRLRKVTFGGSGLQPGVSAAAFNDLGYEGRGS